MYKVEIRVQEKGSKEKKATFVIGDIDSSAYHDEMNAVSDYLYGLDIPFDVDADGDVDAADAKLLRDYLVHRTASLPDAQAADLNGDGILNAADLAILKSMLLD